MEVLVVFPMVALAYPTSWYLSVPIILQGNQPICWACSSASAIQYISGNGSGIPSLADLEAETGYYGGAPWSAVDYVLAYWGIYYNETYSKPSFNTVATSISSGDPVIVSCDNATEGHVVELRGYAAGSNPSVSYMDPNYGAYQAQAYSTFTVQNDKTIQIADYNLHE